MIKEPPVDILRAEQLGGQHFKAFSCCIQPGMGMSIHGQQKKSVTELINILCGIETAEAGTCRLMDQDWKGVTQRQWRERSPAIGFATGEAEMIHNLKVWENLILPLQARTTQRTHPPMDILEKQIVEAFQAAGLNQEQVHSILQSSPDSLDHFEQTACGLVRCHLSGFELLLGEQLLAGMNPVHRSRLINLLNWLGERHPKSGLLLLHHGSWTPDLSQLSYWLPIETLTLEKT